MNGEKNLFLKIYFDNEISVFDILKKYFVNTAHSSSRTRTVTLQAKPNFSIYSSICSLKSTLAFVIATTW